MIFFVQTTAVNGTGFPSKAFNFEVPDIESVKEFSEKIVADQYILGDMLMKTHQGLQRKRLSIFNGHPDQPNIISVKISRMNG